MMENSIKLYLSEHDKRCIAFAKRLLLDHFSKRYTIREIAGLSGINRYKLTYGFKQVYASTIHAFAEEARMKNAKRLLSDPDKPLKEIAAVNGYTSVGNFITAFKKFHGITPGNFRKCFENSGC